MKIQALANSRMVVFSVMFEQGKPHSHKQNVRLCLPPTFASKWQLSRNGTLKGFDLVPLHFHQESTCSEADNIQSALSKCRRYCLSQPGHRPLDFAVHGNAYNKLITRTSVRKKRSNLPTQLVSLNAFFYTLRLFSEENCCWIFV